MHPGITSPSTLTLLLILSSYSSSISVLAKEWDGSTRHDPVPNLPAHPLYPPLNQVPLAPHGAHPGAPIGTAAPHPILGGPYPPINFQAGHAPAVGRGGGRGRGLPALPAPVGVPGSGRAAGAPGTGRAAGVPGGQAPSGVGRGVVVNPAPGQLGRGHFMLGPGAAAAAAATHNGQNAGAARGAGAPAQGPGGRGRAVAMGGPGAALGRGASAARGGAGRSLRDEMARSPPRRFGRGH